MRIDSLLSQSEKRKKEYEYSKSKLCQKSAEQSYSFDTTFFLEKNCAFNITTYSTKLFRFNIVFLISRL